MQACSAEGCNVSVAIVERSGATKVLLKADNSGPHSDGSTGKAFTSANMGRDTAGLAGFIGSNPQHIGLRDMDARMVFPAGGLAIKINSALIGGIGVGGAPSGEINANLRPCWNGRHWGRINSTTSARPSQGQAIQLRRVL